MLKNYTVLLTPCLRDLHVYQLLLVNKFNKTLFVNYFGSGELYKHSL